MAKLKRETLDAIRELAGDTHDLLAQIVRLYLESAPTLIAQMHAGFAVSDMTAVRDIVNQVGGVDVDNPTPIADDSFPTDDYGTMSVTIPSGRQHLNGDLALVYAPFEAGRLGVPVTLDDMVSCRADAYQREIDQLLGLVDVATA